MNRITSSLRLCRHFTLAAIAAGVSAAAFAQTPPAPGASPRIDAIRKAGVLRVGVVNNPPWLAQNTTGEGEPWSGPFVAAGQGVRQAAGREDGAGPGQP
jgi:polar amino acid transport system substrate-binding protein